MVADNAVHDKDQADATDNVANAEGPKVVHKLPRCVRLGANGSEVVKVKLLSASKLKEVAPDSDELNGLWNDRVRTIYVLNELSVEEQWETLRHELLHAIIDIDHEARIAPA